jgi:hypothetical protein
LFTWWARYEKETNRSLHNWFCTIANTNWHNLRNSCLPFVCCRDFVAINHWLGGCAVYGPDNLLFAPWSGAKTTLAVSYIFIYAVGFVYHSNRLTLDHE